MRAPDPTPTAYLPPPAVPGWAHALGPVASDIEAAFLAGAALNSLDNLVRSAPSWAGAWRQRLALKCAAAAVSLAGRTESESQIRDAWHLRAAGADPGPAGNLFAAWTWLAARSPHIGIEAVQSVTELLGLRWSGDLEVLPDRFDDLARSGQPAPVPAAAIMADVQRARPDAELLGWWLADLAVAARLRWPFAVPMMVTQARGGAFRVAGGRGRVRPGGVGFERGMCVALALAAADACRLAADIAPRAARLAAVAPRLRAKGAGEVMRLLLDADAVPGTVQTEQMTRWGARRLFERLTVLDAVRELSGRASFRLYGV